MDILLFGKDNSVTDTLESMLASVDEWNIIRTLSLSHNENNIQDRDHNAAYKVIVANLFEFSTSPKKLTQKITSRFTDLPILILYSYSHDFLISPLIKMGATGYLQIGASEKRLLEAIKTVAHNQKYIGVVNT